MTDLYLETSKLHSGKVYYQKTTDGVLYMYVCCVIVWVSTLGCILKGEGPSIKSASEQLAMRFILARPLSLALNTALYHHAARALAAVAVRPASTVPLSVMTVSSLSGEVEMTRSSLCTIIHQLEDDIPRSLNVRNTVL